MIGADGDTDAWPHLDCQPFQVEWVAYRLDDPRRYRRCLMWRRGFRCQDGELVAADPRDRAPRRKVSESMCNVPKQLVTRGVSERVIDLFELVEVDHEQGHHAPVVD